MNNQYSIFITLDILKCPEGQLIWYRVAHNQMDQCYETNKHNTLPLTISKGIINKFRALYLRMKLERNILLDPKCFTLLRWFPLLLLPSRTPQRHTFKIKKMHTQGIRVFLGRKWDGGWWMKEVLGFKHV